jgi:hypothetical protein
LSERSLQAYLLLPRPADLVKAWIFPVAFAYGALAAGDASGEDLLRAAVTWLALELLIYQARYQWNDIRGFAADQRHPDRHSRGRLPGPPSRGPSHIRASWAVALLRLGLVALLAFALAPLDLGWPLLALSVGVFGAALLYEALRARATGGEERVPPPLAAATLALWGVVGAGYAIRGVGGLAFAVDLTGDTLLLACTVAAFWSFGIAFVTARWALEALAFGRRDLDGRIEWRVQPGQAREHSLALTRWLPGRAPVRAGISQETDGLSDWRALRDARLLAPWNLAAVAAAMAAALSGRLLAGPADSADAFLTAGGAALCAAAVLALPRRWWQALILGVLAFATLLALAGSPRPALVALSFLCVLGAHLFFANQCPRTLANPLRGAVLAASRRLSRPQPGRRRLAIAPPARR